MHLLGYDNQRKPMLFGRQGPNASLAMKQVLDAFDAASAKRHALRLTSDETSLKDVAAKLETPDTLNLSALKPLPGNSANIAPVGNQGEPTKEVVKPAKKKESKLFHWLKGLGRSAVNVTVMLGAVVGGGYMYDQAIGDRDVPVFQMSRSNSPSGLPVDLDAMLDKNTTADLSSKNQGPASPEDGFARMQPSLKIVRSVVPEIADWYEKMYREGRVQFGSLPYAEAMYGSEFYAAYDQVWGKLTIGKEFWGMSELDKAANMVHEFRHAKQNFPKVLSDRIGQALTLRMMSDSCRIEDEAYLYQQAFYRTLGREASSEVQWYLQHRGLMPEAQVQPGPHKVHRH